MGRTQSTKAILGRGRDVDSEKAVMLIALSFVLVFTSQKFNYDPSSLFSLITRFVRATGLFAEHRCTPNRWHVP